MIARGAGSPSNSLGFVSFIRLFANASVACSIIEPGDVVWNWILRRPIRILGIDDGSLEAQLMGWSKVDRLPISGVVNTHAHRRPSRRIPLRIKAPDEEAARWLLELQRHLEAVTPLSKQRTFVLGRMDQDLRTRQQRVPIEEGHLDPHCSHCSVFGLSFGERCA
jgi:hypothetical protein